jgi:hypothetical protein
LEAEKYETVRTDQFPDRKCPSCSSDVGVLQLSAYAMPAETLTLPWLHMINKAIGWSVRTFGQSTVNELQFIAFTHVCKKCSLISWWDLSVEELNDAMTNPQSKIKIAWASNPEVLKQVLEKIPQEYRAPLQALLNNLTPEIKKQ